MKTETTIRRAKAAVSLIIDGAIRHIETDYGPDDNPDRQSLMPALFEAIHSEVDDWDDGASRELQPYSATVIDFLARLQPYTLQVIRDELRGRDDPPAELIGEITEILVALDGDEAG